MKELIAYCGLNCAECSAYIATQENDNTKRQKVAEEWQKSFNPDIKAEDINCDGCTAQSTRLFAHCLQCKVRLCGIERKVKNCAYCPDYACDNLLEYFKMAPKMKESLDNIRKTLK
jgi:hypothetical protein